MPVNKAPQDLLVGDEVEGYTVTEVPYTNGGGAVIVGVTMNDGSVQSRTWLPAAGNVASVTVTNS